MPVFPPAIPPGREPAFDMNASTFGSCRTTSASACCRRFMASKEIPSAASVGP